MADYKVNEAAWNVAKSVGEANQTIAENAVAAQERNMAFAQNTLENGIEVLKSHAENTRTLLREQSEQAQRQRVDVQAVLNTVVAAQERNLRYAQNTFENGTEVLKSHVGSTHALAQTLAEQSQKQQESFRELAHESVNAYVDLLFAPFSYYKQALDTAESITRQGMETAEKIAHQSFETAQKVTRQSAEAVQKAAYQAQKAAELVTQ